MNRTKGWPDLFIAMPGHVPRIIHRRCLCSIVASNLLYIDLYEASHEQNLEMVNIPTPVSLPPKLFPPQILSSPTFLTEILFLVSNKTIPIPIR